MTQPLSNPAASNCAPLPPHRAGARAHCQRVAAVVDVLARRLGFERRLTGLAVEAARLHHDWPVLLGPEGRGRLLEDLDARVLPAEAPAPPQEVQAVLEALRPTPSRTCPATPTATAARLVELACCFVERWEYQPYEPRTFREIAAEIQHMAADGIFLPEQAEALANAPAVDDRQVAATMATLPVFPAVAAQALKVTRNPRSGLDEVEAIIRSDPVIAGEILRLANSPLLSPRQEISTIRQAIAYVGFECTCRVLSALLLRPMFNSDILRPLWKHSVELAGLAVSIAPLSGVVEPEEAFLAALLHDIGRLVLFKLPDNGEQYVRLLATGVEPLFAEVLLCGSDHGAVGARLLRQWRLPAHLVEAVAHHHQPENTESPLASLLYLAEFWRGMEEDCPSTARLHLAMRRAGIPLEILEGARFEDPLGGLTNALV